MRGIGKRFDNVGHMDDIVGGYIDHIATPYTFGVRKILDDKNTWEIVWYITAVIVMTQRQNIHYYRGLIDGLLIRSKKKYDASYEKLFYEYAQRVYDAEGKRRGWK